MNNQQSKVQDYIRRQGGAAVTASSISFALGIPQPSVRRTIHELKFTHGMHIVSSHYGYRLES